MNVISMSNVFKVMTRCFSSSVKDLNTLLSAKAYYTLGQTVVVTMFQ